jgi:hypothetical protein
MEQVLPVGAWLGGRTWTRCRGRGPSGLGFSVPYRKKGVCSTVPKEACGHDSLVPQDRDHGWHLARRLHSLWVGEGGNGT